MINVSNRILHLLGYEIRRKSSVENRPSKRTGRVSRYSTKTGNYFLPDDAHQDLIARAIKHNQIFDEEIYRTAKEFINSGDIVLDVGANFGQMSVLFAKLVGEAGRIYSFEADNFVFEILRKNISANQCENIIPVFGAVYHEFGKKLVFPEQDFIEFGTYGSYGIDYTNSKAGRAVDSITIDSLNIEHRVAFMKIDIQGGDLQAMQGARNTIEKYRMPIIFEYEYLFETRLGMKFQHYIDFVDSIGYKFERIINGQNYLIIPR